MCLNLLSDLNINISYYLNNSDITESEDYINNNFTIERIINNLINNNNSLNNNDDDIRWNISGINETFYLNEIELFFVCENNNNHNKSYIILNNIPEKDKNFLDEYINNIIKF